MDSLIIKAISIRQPWATFIVEAKYGKDIENRSWFTGHRGPVLIHASKAHSAFEFEQAIAFAREIVPRRTWGPKAERASQIGIDWPLRADCPRGGFVGVADIVDCVDEHSSPWFIGPFGFVMASPRPLPFLPFKGSLGLFDVPWPYPPDQFPHPR